MFFYFEPNFIEKFLWESVFSNFGHVTFRETKIHILSAILKRNIFWMFFLLMYGRFRCTQIWYKFRTEILTGKYLKMVGPSGPPLCNNESEK